MAYGQTCSVNEIFIMFNLKTFIIIILYWYFYGFFAKNFQDKITVFINLFHCPWCAESIFLVYICLCIYPIYLWADVRYIPWFTPFNNRRLNRIACIEQKTQISHFISYSWISSWAVLPNDCCCFCPMK